MKIVPLVFSVATALLVMTPADAAQYDDMSSFETVTKGASVLDFESF